MLLYKCDNGLWAGTKKDAKALSDDTFDEVDVPTKKAELISFLNDQLDEFTAQATTAQSDKAWQDDAKPEAPAPSEITTAGVVNGTHSEDFPALLDLVAKRLGGLLLGGYNPIPAFIAMERKPDSASLLGLGALALTGSRATIDPSVVCNDPAPAVSAPEEPAADPFA